MSLTELAVRSAKAEGKITNWLDGGGLQLWVTPDGANLLSPARLSLRGRPEGTGDRRLPDDRTERGPARSRGREEAARKRGRSCPWPKSG